tara:strand:- start:2807 stop:3253 length:447 start_codon:yes stop_codon:yes gene_type:complete
MKETEYIGDIISKMIKEAENDSDTLHTEIIEVVKNSKHCKVCDRDYKIIPTHRQSFCPPCRKVYMRDYKRLHKNNVKKSRSGLDITKESKCCSCEQVKPIEQFYKANKYKCKVCLRITQKERMKIQRKVYEENKKLYKELNLKKENNI